MSIQPSSWTDDSVTPSSWLLPSSTTYSDSDISYSDLLIFYVGAVDTNAVSLSAFTEVSLPVGASYSEPATSTSAFTDSDSSLSKSSWTDAT